MIISRIRGGLGNQMFQYTVGRVLALRNKTVLKLDTLWYTEPNKAITQREFQLFAFPIQAEVATKEEINRCLWGRTKIRPTSQCQTYYPQPSFSYWKGFESITAPAYLSGYWQDETYFAAYRSLILKEFSFPTLPKATLPLAAQIQNIENSICLHVRRGDYVTNAETNAAHGTCSADYYQRAVTLLAEKFSNIHIFIFSDTPEWIKTNFSLKKLAHTIIDFPEHTHSPWHDMHLMSLCKHHIIANSSFSWWGAWLSKQQGTIIAPKQWLAAKDRQDDNPSPERWIKL